MKDLKQIALSTHLWILLKKLSSQCQGLRQDDRIRASPYKPQAPERMTPNLKLDKKKVTTRTEAGTTNMTSPPLEKTESMGSRHQGYPASPAEQQNPLPTKNRTMAEKIQANERKVKKWLRTANPVKLLEAKQNTRRADPNNKWRKTAPKDTNEPSTAPAKMCV